MIILSEIVLGFVVGFGGVWLYLMYTNKDD